MKVMTDIELLELAGKAAGYALVYEREYLTFFRKDVQCRPIWNPLTDDGDALRLAVKLQIVSGKYDDYASACALGNPVVGEVTVWGHEEKDSYAATRRAIVRAAAEIAKASSNA
jgi:hypothetical protein